MRPVPFDPSRRAFLAGLGLSAPVLLGSSRLHASQSTVRSGTLGALRRTVALEAALDHPQGITASADGATWWVTSVVRSDKQGLLAAFRASDGTLLQRVEVQDGAPSNVHS